VLQGGRHVESDRGAAHASGARMPTGIAGFDEIADGGLPRGGVTVVVGGAGAGKTTFAMQVLATGALEHEEPGILVAFEESAGRILANTLGFVWGGPALHGKGVHIVDAQLSQAVEQAGEFDLIGLLAIVGAQARKFGARRVVFDGIDVLLNYLGSAAAIRREAFRLRDWVHQSGLSGIVTAKADAARDEASGDFYFMQFMADCVVTLHHRVAEGTALRFIRVAKYRGAAHSSNEFPLVITHTGLELAADSQLDLACFASTERVSTGVERLDTMLAGGYYRGSSVLITGVPGTAKTSLCSAFAEAAARRGERTLFLSFDEAPEQVVRNVASIGIQLAPHLASETLVLRSFRGRAESPEAHIARIRALIQQIEPRNLVVDPLSALAHHGYEPIAEGAALQVLDIAKRAGITIVFTSLLGTASPLTEQTPMGISTIADTWIHVSNVNAAGERNRALSIIKSRGTGHSNQVRELLLSDQGITLTDVYAVGGEVLMGTLRWEKENQERRARADASDEALLRERRAELALAETKASLATLIHAQAIQEAELQRLQKLNKTTVEVRSVEDAARLDRRGADATSRTIAPARDGGQEIEL
jgi:circadian clock protein KaiC